MIDYEIVRRLERIGREIERLETLEFPDKLIVVQDEGVTLPGELFSEMNFIGSPVTASVNPVNDDKVDVAVSGGGGGISVVGCQVERQNWNLGQPIASQQIIAWGTEAYDPAGLIDVGVQPERIYITSTGYWMMMVGVTAAITEATLTDDVDKVITFLGDIEVWSEAPLTFHERHQFHGGAAHALTASWTKRFANLEMLAVYRYTGGLTNPHFRNNVRWDRRPTWPSWNTRPEISLDIWGWCCKMGDL